MLVPLVRVTVALPVNSAAQQGVVNRVIAKLYTDYGRATRSRPRSAVFATYTLQTEDADGDPVEDPDLFLDAVSLVFVEIPRAMNADLDEELVALKTFIIDLYEQADSDEPDVRVTVEPVFNVVVP